MMARRPGFFSRWWRRAAARLGRLRIWLAQDSGMGEGVPRAFVVFLVCFGLGMIVISLVGDQGLIAYLRLQREASELRERVDALTAREQRLRLEIKALHDDADYIEQVARRQLRLVRPNEIVIELPRDGGKDER
jgi:cell division protein FtsB